MTNNNWEPKLFEILQRTNDIQLIKSAHLFVKDLLTEKEKDGYQRGITDRTIWNGVYNIGAKEEREKCNQEHKAELESIKGEIEKFETYDDEPDNCRRLKIETLFILDRHINSLTTE